MFNLNFCGINNHSSNIFFIVYFNLDYQNGSGLKETDFIYILSVLVPLCLKLL